MSKTLVVTFKTTKFLPERNRDGSTKDEVIFSKLKYNSVEYLNWIKNAKNSGFNLIQIHQVTEQSIKDGKKEYTPIEVPDYIKKDLDTAMKEEVKKTPEQIQIDELKAKIEELTNSRNEPPKVESTPKKGKEQDPELQKARAEYYKEKGEAADNRWSIDRIKKELNKK